MPSPTPLQSFFSDLTLNKNAEISSIVDDNAKCHRDEKLENSFSRLPLTPSDSFQKNRNASRWDDSFEMSDNKDISPKPSSDKSLLSPVRQLSRRSFLISEASLSILTFEDDQAPGHATQNSTPKCWWSWRTWSSLCMYKGHHHYDNRVEHIERQRMDTNLVGECICMFDIRNSESWQTIEQSHALCFSSLTQSLHWHDRRVRLAEGSLQ